MTAAIRHCGSWANTASTGGTFLSTLGINSWLGTGPDPETGWTTEFAETEHMLRDIDMSLQERDYKQKKGADAARITAAVRGKISQAAVMLENLQVKILPSLQLTEAESNRRRDALGRMRDKLEQLTLRVSTSQAALDRAELFGGDVDPVKSTMRSVLAGGGGGFEGGGRAMGGRGPSSGDLAGPSGRPPLSGQTGGGGLHRSGSYAGPQRHGVALGGQLGSKVHSETDITASLDTRGLLQQQNRALADQDRLLNGLSAGVANLKRTSLAISEELDSQKAIVERLDEQVDRTHSQLKKCETKATAIVGAPSESWAASIGVPSAVTSECSIM